MDTYIGHLAQARTHDDSHETAFADITTEPAIQACAIVDESISTISVSDDDSPILNDNAFYTPNAANDVDADMHDCQYVLTVPRYEINLDVHPHERWNQVVDIYSADLQRIVANVDALYESLLGYHLGGLADATISTVLALVTHYSNRVAYHDELQGIADRAQVSFGRLVVLQLLYELLAACTSVIQLDGNKVPVHARTLDWEHAFLRGLTVEYDFVRGGELVYSATSWVGYVGIFTGMRASSWAVSLNYRAHDRQSYLRNLSNMLAHAWPAGFLIRHTLDTVASYSRAVRILRTAELIAPCYFTISGVAAHEGCTVTRSAQHAYCANTLSASVPAAWLVQANCDWWTVPSQHHAAAHYTIDGVQNTLYCPIHDAPCEFPQQCRRMRDTDHSAEETSHCNDGDAQDDDEALCDEIPFNMNLNESDLLQSVERVQVAESVLTGFTAASECNMWKLLAQPPIYNDYTVYGTYMCAAHTVLHTRKPLGFYGFEPFPTRVRHHLEWKHRVEFESKRAFVTNVALSLQHRMYCNFQMPKVNLHYFQEPLGTSSEPITWMHRLATLFAPSTDRPLTDHERTIAAQLANEERIRVQKTKSSRKRKRAHAHATNVIVDTEPSTTVHTTQNATLISTKSTNSADDSICNGLVTEDAPVLEHMSTDSQLVSNSDT